ncbi:diguanylate cyclase domain-containing protein [Neptunomonas qingdaonensis]|uniref:PAS domain S-box-containing protein/diguanylate cyclase (GGDEF) domain-containing protein n=1 Tax=Neptunomonas qingdaonensis TaxID=1045558 RepID=A0A1I2LSX1_9GAMM|nr:diguanylate cyclase [Neptunomonas qingdaonensis]SFF81609.1 PAS domain S-box-containing protein/diguanylate cyclase (GGDEF) domain-containing protein [Neptunomonas qingdaonensis]
MNAATGKGPVANHATASAHLRHSLTALLLVCFAAGLRVWPLQAFESELTWLTFYPAVISAALYAGLYAGLLATVLACLAVTFLWQLFVTQPFIENRFDLLEMAIFAITCVFISYLVETVRRTQKALDQAETASKASIKREQFIKSIIDSMPSMIGYWGSDLRCRYANNAYREWFGKPPEDIIGITFQELAGDHLFTLNEPHIRRALAGEPQRFERILNKANGNVGHIIGHYIPDFDAAGTDNDSTVKGFSILASEVTVFKETEAKLKLAACVFENTLDGVLVTDADGVILSVNPAFSEITGYATEEAVGQNPRMLQSNRHDQVFYASMWKEIKTNGRWNGEIWNRRKDGDLYLERMTISMVRDEDGEPIRYVSVFSDITALWRKDEYIKHLAFHDALTDLPNRTLVTDRINQKLLHYNREQCSLALMFLDLDGFKLVNDQFGHNVGDDLLKEVAKRLLALLRKSDTVARVGGDEFMFIFDNPKGKDEIEYVANRVISSINEPIETLGEVLQIGASVGIAMFPADGDTCVDLIKNADTAMYAAKRSGKNNIRFFSPENNFIKT